MAGPRIHYETTRLVPTADGRCPADGRWSYTYDAENRLTSVSATSTAVSAGHPYTMFAFSNDYLGRRVRKVDAWWNGSSWVNGNDRRLIYDGWNVMAEYWDAYGPTFPSANVRHSYWGLDLSGTLRGAGGVGGLLIITEGGNSYLPAYDANGNVHALISASTGSVDAAYEYDAFGNTLRESGAYAASNPFRFSTKYTDIETSLVYYGLRYYSPTLGRFINKDPIEEQGGLNLYGFCSNNGVNRWDMLGMDAASATYARNEIGNDFVLDPQYGSFGEFIGAIHPTWQHQGDMRWYDPDRDAGFEFVGSSTSYTEAGEAPFDPSASWGLQDLRSQIDIAFAQNDRFNWELSHPVIQTEDGRYYRTSVTYGPLQEAPTAAPIPANQRQFQPLSNADPTTVSLLNQMNSNQGFLGQVESISEKSQQAEKIVPALRNGAPSFTEYRREYGFTGYSTGSDGVVRYDLALQRSEPYDAYTVGRMALRNVAPPDMLLFQVHAHSFSGGSSEADWRSAGTYTFTIRPAQGQVEIILPNGTAGYTGSINEVFPGLAGGPNP